MGVLGFPPFVAILLSYLIDFLLIIMVVSQSAKNLGRC